MSYGCVTTAHVGKCVVFVFVAYVDNESAFVKMLYRQCVVFVFENGDGSAIEPTHGQFGLASVDSAEQTVGVDSPAIGDAQRILIGENLAARFVDEASVVFVMLVGFEHLFEVESEVVRLEKHVSAGA